MDRAGGVAHHLVRRAAQQKVRHAGAVTGDDDAVDRVSRRPVSDGAPGMAIDDDALRMRDARGHLGQLRLDRRAAFGEVFLRHVGDRVGRHLLHDVQQGDAAGLAGQKLGDAHGAGGVAVFFEGYGDEDMGVHLGSPMRVAARYDSETATCPALFRISPGGAVPAATSPARR